MCKWPNVSRTNLTFGPIDLNGIFVLGLELGLGLGYWLKGSSYSRSSKLDIGVP